MALRLFARLDDRLNPIVVKELRQAVQSRFVTSVLLLFLIVQLFIVGMALISAGVDAVSENPENYLGRSVFRVLQGILLGTCLLFIPGYTGLRLASERSEVNLDLLFITTLRPRAIIWGKFLSALILAVVVFSACAPFMTFTYLLRGIDVPTILLILVIDILAVAGAVQICIFMAVVPGNRVAKGLIGLMGFSGLIGFLTTSITGTVALVTIGIGTYMDTKEFWGAAGTVLVAVVSGIALFFTWSVAFISAPSANRAWPVRVCNLAVLLATGLMFGAWSRVLNSALPLNLWVIFMSSLGILGVVTAVCERDHWGSRVARTIPCRWWLRVPAFLFYSGAAGGLAFAFLLIGLTWLGLMAWLKTGTHSWDWENLKTTVGVMGVLLLYTFCYAMTAALFRNWFGMRPIYTWSFMVFLMVIGGTLPFVVSYFMFYKEWRYETHFYWLLPNPIFAATEVPRWVTGDRLRIYFAFAGTWALLVAVLNGPWLIRQIARFRPYAGNRSYITVEEE
jgi:hypothetical protein